MNYRHAYHAGNFADVLKHAVLSLVIAYYKQKSAPFRVIDTHAGRGIYDLAGLEPNKTGEWRDGIGRLMRAPLSGTIANLLAPYLHVIRSLNDASTFRTYPGSPLLARRLMRPGDTLIANELHPQDAGELRHLLAHESDTKVLELDAYTALRALLPPKERRAIVLVDPPFERTDEFQALARGLGEATKRFATGTYLIWYPIKDLRLVEPLQRAIAELKLAHVLRLELMLRAPQRSDVLNGCGMFVVNPPYTLEADARLLLPALVEAVSQGPGASSSIQASGENI